MINNEYLFFRLMVLYIVHSSEVSVASYQLRPNCIARPTIIDRPDRSSLFEKGEFSLCWLSRSWANLIFFVVGPAARAINLGAREVVGQCYVCGTSLVVPLVSSLPRHP